MSPFMALIVLVVLAFALVFVTGLVTRKPALLLVGSPGPILFLVWYFLASARPNPQAEFDLRFGAENRTFVTDIQTIKPIMMDGHFISFRVSPADFESRIKPNFSTEMPLQSPTHFLLRQQLPDGWPSAIQSATMALHREVDYADVFLLYFPDEQRAYATVRYDQW